MKTISILGSTGSIGTQTLDIVSQFSNDFQVLALSAGNNISLFKEQLKIFKPKFACIQDKHNYQDLSLFTKENCLNIELLHGEEGLNQLACLSVDLCIVAIVGTAGILPTYHALKQQNPVALACKEVLVSAGDIIMDLVKANNQPLIPIDSEHAAIKQCLESTHSINDISTITLTASGGPFWERDARDFKDITRNDALKHPNWTMGQKITIDSATMVNKGLEIIEAHHLFQCDYSKLEVLIHRQSIVHGIVEFIDGNILAHLSPTDMHFPIQYALTYPKRYPTAFEKFNFKTAHTLTFEQPDPSRFPLLNTAITCGQKKGTYPVVFNAANEAAVHLFLAEKIPFLDIQKHIEKTLENFKHYKNPSITDIISIDKQIKHDIVQTTT